MERGDGQDGCRPHVPQPPFPRGPRGVMTPSSQSYWESSSGPCPQLSCLCPDLTRSRPTAYSNVCPSGTGLQEKAGEQMAQRHRRERTLLEGKPAVLRWGHPLASDLDQLPKTPPAGGSCLSPPQPPPVPLPSYKATDQKGPGSFPGEASQGEVSEHGPGSTRQTTSPRCSATAPCTFSSCSTVLVSPWSLPRGYPQLEVPLQSQVAPTHTPLASLTFHPRPCLEHPCLP